MSDDVIRTETFAVSGPICVDCRLGYGAVTVRTEDDLTHAVVTLRPRQPHSDAAHAATVNLHGRTLSVRSTTSRPGWFDFSMVDPHRGDEGGMDVELVVPTRTAVKIRNDGPDIAVLGQSGAVDIATGTTAVTLGVVDGDLRLRYGGGPARAERISGTAVFKTGAGTVAIGESARVVMACGSGQLTVGVAHDRVHLRAGSGGAEIDVAEADVDLVSGSGGLTVGLRPGQAARLDVLTGGRFHSDLAVEAAAPSGGSPITVRARTGSGTVRIRRAS